MCPPLLLCWHVQIWKPVQKYVETVGGTTKAKGDARELQYFLWPHKQRSEGGGAEAQQPGQRLRLDRDAQRKIDDLFKRKKKAVASEQYEVAARLRR